MKNKINKHILNKALLNNKFVNSSKSDNSINADKLIESDNLIDINESIDIKMYNLFINHKFKTLYQMIKSNIELLKMPINDGKTLMYYAILTNNNKLLKKLMKIDLKQLFETFNHNLFNDDISLCLPYLALINGFYPMFFYLIDELILNNLHDNLFGINFKNNSYPTLTHAVILKSNYSIFNKYIQKYDKYINWTYIYDDISYLFYMTYNYKEKLNEIIKMIDNIKTKSNLSEYSNLFEYPKEMPSIFNIIMSYYCHDNHNITFETLIKNRNIQYHFFDQFVNQLVNKSEQSTNNSKESPDESKQLESTIKNKCQISLSIVKKYIDLYPTQLNFVNLTNMTILYKIAEFNDLDLFDYCVKSNANINHVSPLGYYNLCHHIMLKCKHDMVEYALKLNMNFNDVDSNNETPIFSLLRNKQFNNLDQQQITYSDDQNFIDSLNSNLLSNIKSKSESETESESKSNSDQKKLEINNQNMKSEKLIEELLLKTSDWNIQNVLGQTVMHLLFMRSDFQNFYPILSKKYFDINISNKVGTKPLDIFKHKLTQMKYDDNKIENEIIKLKELIAPSYLRILTESNNITIPLNIQLNCKQFNLNDSNFKKTSCWTSVINSLSNSSNTNIDKLSMDYNNLNINDHKFAHYNLFEAKDINTYYYISIITEKYKYIGVCQNSSNLNKDDIYKLSNLNNLNQSISQMAMTNDKINFLQTLILNSLMYSNLYPLNIYWIDDVYYMLPYNIIQATINSINAGKKIIICRINIIKEILHANILLIDVINKRIIRFEPQGGIKKTSTEFFDNKISEIFIQPNTYFESFKYYKPSDYEPLNGLQSLSQENDPQYVRKGDIGGFCVAWCMWFVEFYVSNLSNNLMSNDKFKLLISKAIKKIINNGNIISEYIRNYANYLYAKSLEKMSLVISYSNSYYEKYTSFELNNMYNFHNMYFNPT